MIRLYYIAIAVGFTKVLNALCSCIIYDSFTTPGNVMFIKKMYLHRASNCYVVSWVINGLLTC